MEAATRVIVDRALASEYRRALLDRFFEANRKKNFRVAVKPQRAPVDHAAIRSERARNLLAILLRCPVILPGIEESLASIDLPEGHPTTLRAALLDWPARGDVLDSALLLDQLAYSRAGEAVTWALRGSGLAKAAAPTAQPAEALDAWWHFFDPSRGAAELAEDRARAERSLIENNDPGAQQRLSRLTEALAALRESETDSGAGMESQV